MVWGDDSLGQLGIGSDPAAGIFRSLPERLDITGDKNPENDRIVHDPGWIFPIGGSHLSAKTAAALSIKSRQQLLVWGNNSSGQLALGNTISQNRPAVLSGTFNGWTGDSFLPFDAVASGGYHLLVLSSKGLLGAAGRGDRGQLGNLSVLDRSQLTPVAVPDVIRPVWLSGAKLSARFDADENLVVRWPKAQDNRLATGYKVILERSDGQIQEFGVGNKLSLSINKVSSRFAYEIKVLAYDADSVHADTATLSFLADYILPAEAASQGSVPADYFSDIIQSVWQINNLAHHWAPDPRGALQPLEMPLGCQFPSMGKTDCRCRPIGRRSSMRHWEQAFFLC